MAQPTIEHCKRVLKLPSKPDFGTLHTLEGPLLRAPFDGENQKRRPNQTMVERIRVKVGSKMKNVGIFFLPEKKLLISFHLKKKSNS